MRTGEPWIDFSILIALIEFGSVLTIFITVSRSFFLLLRHPLRPAQEHRRAHTLIHDGVLNGLSFIAAATLLKALTLNTWDQLAHFAAIVLIRAFLKQAFQRRANFEVIDLLE